MKLSPSLYFLLIIHSIERRTRSICKRSSWVHRRNEFGSDESRPGPKCHIWHNTRSSDRHFPKPTLPRVYPSLGTGGYCFCSSCDVSRIDPNGTSRSQRSRTFCGWFLCWWYYEMGGTPVECVAVVVMTRDMYRGRSDKKRNSPGHHTVVAVVVSIRMCYCGVVGPCWSIDFVARRHQSNHCTHKHIYIWNKYTPRGRFSVRYLHAWLILYDTLYSHVGCRCCI